MNICRSIKCSHSNPLHATANRLLSTSAMRRTTTTPQGDLYKHQNDLPPLPVPKLAHTLDLYKESIKPLYPYGEKDEEFIKYAKIIDEFATGTQGSGLQSKLERFAADKRNWLAAFWDNYAYLDYRDPVSPFVSYFFSHRDANTAVGKDQLLKSASLTRKVLEFMETVEHETLEPELIKGAPFCMESFKWMFSNCRVPGESRDYNLVYDGSKNRFMIVISNGHIYKLQTHDDATDSILPFNALYYGLAEVLKDSEARGPNETPVGVLTSSNRDEWFSNYQKLNEISIVNKVNFEDIFKSSFVLCLDDCLPNTIEAKSRNCWHGNGLNRWFDKPLQFFVARNGSSGFLGEHSKMDGTPTLRMNDWLVGEMYKLDIDGNVAKPTTVPAIRQINFEINNEISEAIKTETETFNETVNSLDIKTWQYFGLGKDDIKAFNCSPDSFVQMLIQLAYYKYTGTLRPTYESASTRKYFRGRTETNRSVSSEALQFVKDWENPSVPVQEKLKSFRAALKSHGNYIKLASSGLGVDRHLFGLKQMIGESDKDSEVIKQFFDNPIFSYSQYWYLSTSQLSSENFNGYGWSPVVPEGLGLAYMINRKWLHINITNYKENPFGLKVDEMAYFLTLSVQELAEALRKETVKAKL